MVSTPPCHGGGRGFESLQSRRAGQKPGSFISQLRRHGEIGRRKGLKIPRSNIRAGSSPAAGRKKTPIMLRLSAESGFRFSLFSSGMSLKPDNVKLSQQSRQIFKSYSKRISDRLKDIPYSFEDGVLRVTCIQGTGTGHRPALQGTASSETLPSVRAFPQPGFS